MIKGCEIKGGYALRGEVTPIPNKNSLMGGLPIAALNLPGVLYHQVPQTSDVECFLSIYKKLGAKVEENRDDVFIDGQTIKSSKIDEKLARKMRSAFMLVGPLLARFGKVNMPLPGGCKLGFRGVATHVHAFRQLGVRVANKNNFIEFEVPKKDKNLYNIWLLEASVTATTNIALYAIAKGINVNITDAACEPHIVNVFKILRGMGACIDGIGTNKIQIRNKHNLTTGEFNPLPDHIDIAGYIVAAAITKGKIRIKGANIPEVINGLINYFELFGVNIQKIKNDLVVDGKKSNLKIKKEFFPLAAKDLPKLPVRPWPGFPVDALPPMVVLACKSQGSMLFKNWMYESGFTFTEALGYMGADIYTSDPERIIVSGDPIEFQGTEVTAPKVIQGAKALFLAGLAAKGTTIIYGIDILRRRYPDIFEVYKKFGARIKVFESKRF